MVVDTNRNNVNQEQVSPRYRNQSTTTTARRGATRRDAVLRAMWNGDLTPLFLLRKIVANDEDITARMRQDPNFLDVYWKSLQEARRIKELVVRSLEAASLH